MTCDQRLIADGDVTLTEASTEPAANFEWFKDGISNQGPNTTNTYVAAAPSPATAQTNTYKVTVSHPPKCSVDVTYDICWCNEPQSINVVCSSGTCTVSGDNINGTGANAYSFDWRTASGNSAGTTNPVTYNFSKPTSVVVTRCGVSFNVVNLNTTPCIMPYLKGITCDNTSCIANVQFNDTGSYQWYDSNFQAISGETSKSISQNQLGDTPAKAFSITACSQTVYYCKDTNGNWNPCS